MRFHHLPLRQLDVVCLGGCWLRLTYQMQTQVRVPVVARLAMDVWLNLLLADS